MTTRKQTKGPQSVADVMGPFTEEAIHAVDEVTLRRILEELHAMASGIASAFLDPKSTAAAHQAELVKGGIALEDAIGLAADGESLLRDIADRDTKLATAHVAVAHVTDGAREVDKHIGSLTYTLRGKLGAKDPDLRAFGIAPLAPGGRRAKSAAQAAAPPKVPTT